jgi:hypothetical protein
MAHGFALPLDTLWTHQLEFSFGLPRILGILGRGDIAPSQEIFVR